MVIDNIPFSAVLLTIFCIFIIILIAAVLKANYRSYKHLKELLLDYKEKWQEEHEENIVLRNELVERNISQPVTNYKLINSPEPELGEFLPRATDSDEADIEELRNQVEQRKKIGR